MKEETIGLFIGGVDLGAFVWLDTRILYDESVARVQSLMDEKLWNKSYSEGQSRSVNQAIVLAVESLGKVSLHIPRRTRVDRYDKE